MYKKEHMDYYTADGKLTAQFKYQFSKEIDQIKMARIIQNTDPDMTDQPVRMERILFRFKQ